MKVLVIDDHPLILHAMRSLIQQLDESVEVVTAVAAQPARDALADGAEFDLALLDLELGDDDGFALLEELRNAYPALPIVIVAASDHRDDVMRAIDLGAMGFVPKCTSNDTLLSALGDPAGHGVALLDGRGVLGFGGVAVVGEHHRGLRTDGELADEPVVGVVVAEDPAGAVEVDDYRQRPAGALGAQDGHRHLAGGPPGTVVSSVSTVGFLTGPDWTASMVLRPWSGASSNR